MFLPETAMQQSLVTDISFPLHRRAIQIHLSQHVSILAVLSLTGLLT